MKQKEINFSKFSSIKIGGIKIANYIESENISTYYPIIGGANNILISDNIKEVFILSKKFDYIKIIDNYLHIGGATLSGKIVNFCKKNDIANFEWVYSLPASLGGMIKMNAGVKEYETFNYLHSIKTYQGYIQKKDIDFSYRQTNIKDIIYEGVFELKKGFNQKLVDKFTKFRSNQPNMASAGSCFKNPKEKYFAGEVIEKVGLKGYKIGNMGFSDIHSNFLVNHGEGSFDDAISLIELAKQKVKDKFNINLKEEIVILR
jgi:UDP-N-acetylmuramate dehydrogenase